MIRKYFHLRLLIYFVVALAIASCKTPYNPPLKASQSNLLVVEGFIDGAAPTIIKLSRTRMISNGDTATVKKELFAKVFVEDNQSNKYSLFDMGNGVYTSYYPLHLNPDYKYRLHIITANGNEYNSGFVPYIQTPAIDAVGWKIKDDGGIQVYLNTHNQNNAARYYRWEYSETWEFHSAYTSYVKYLPIKKEVVPRTEMVNICWRSDESTNILLGSSAKLTDNTITEQSLVNIKPHGKKLSVLYSIKVKQYALDIEAYNYWEAMRNNTEKMGSIFDPQPNQTVGNIHCTTTPLETVVGYIGAGASFEERYFIDNKELPPNWNLRDRCQIKEVTQDSIEYYFSGRGYSPIDEAVAPSGALSYPASYTECIDCTLQGTNVKPGFWP